MKKRKITQCISCFKDDISVLPFFPMFAKAETGKFTEHTHHS